MREKFLCLDCNLLDELTKHGRCQRCNSDGVISAYAHKPMEFPVTQYSAIQELERIFAL